MNANNPTPTPQPDAGADQCPPWCAAPSSTRECHQWVTVDGQPQRQHVAYSAAGPQYFDEAPPAYYVEAYGVEVYRDGRRTHEGAWVSVEAPEILTPADALMLAEVVKYAGETASLVDHVGGVLAPPVSVLERPDVQPTPDVRPGVSSACRVLRCPEPAVWRVTSSRTSPTDARPFAADYCGQHAGQLLAVPTTVEVKRIGAGR